TMRSTRAASARRRSGTAGAVSTARDYMRQRAADSTRPALRDRGGQPAVITGAGRAEKMRHGGERLVARLREVQVGGARASLAHAGARDDHAARIHDLAPAGEW